MFGYIGALRTMTSGRSQFSMESSHYVIGPKEYRQEHVLLIRIDEILTTSGLETEFIALAMAPCGFAPARESAKHIESFSRKCVLALRGNIARHFKGMDHRDFCIRLADSPLF